MSETFRIRTSCKGVDAGQTRGRALRMANTMGETTVATQKHTSHGYENITEAKLRIFEDGSGLFEFKRGEESFTLRWNEENAGPMTMKAFFGDFEAELVPAERGAA